MANKFELHARFALIDKIAMYYNSLNPDRYATSHLLIQDLDVPPGITPRWPLKPVEQVMVLDTLLRGYSSSTYELMPRLAQMALSSGNVPILEYLFKQGVIGVLLIKKRASSDTVACSMANMIYHRLLELYEGALSKRGIILRQCENNTVKARGIMYKGLLKYGRVRDEHIDDWLYGCYDMEEDEVAFEFILGPT